MQSKFSTHLRFEELEERRLLAVYAGSATSWGPLCTVGETEPTTWLVTTPHDQTGGHEGLLSLREALDSAQNGDTIRFDATLSGKTILLAGEELVISSDVTIDASDLAKGVTINAGGQSRIFTVEGGVTAHMTSLQICGGSLDGAGGGINNAGSLTLTGCLVVENRATRGGGIENLGTLTLINCTVSGNYAEECGGGIDAFGGTVIVSNSIVAENRAKTADNDIRKEEGALLTASYALSPFTDWTTSDHLVAYDPNRLIFADAANGIYTLAPGSQAIDVGNNALVATERDFNGAVRIQHLVVDLGAYEAGIGTTTYVSGWSTFYDAEEHQPEIEGLEEEDTVEYSVDGGQTFTPIPPTFIEMGSYPLSVRISRPLYETYTVSGNYEVREVPSSIVSSLEDLVDPVDGKISLREAIAYTPTGGTVVFAEDLGGKTVTLSGAELKISESLVIDASDLEGGLTIDAGGTSRVFALSGGTAAKPVELIHLTITGGITTENGGGILARDASLKLTDCTVATNTALHGGGLYTDGGTAILANCLFEKNTATMGGGVHLSTTVMTITDSQFLSNTALYYYGGGIENVSGTLTMTSCTVSKNLAGNGGGIDVDRGMLTMTACAISENSALRRLNIDDGYYYGGYGGGIYNYRGEISLSNCAITDNEASSWGGGVETYGNMNLLNCTIASNSAEYGGGVDIDAGPEGRVNLYNTIVAQNTASAESNDVSLSSGTVAAYHSLSSFEDWTESESAYSFDGLTTIFTDPEHGDYTLRRGSRCVNGGSNTYVTTTTDLGGNTRIVGNLVDLGAYELQNSPSKLEAPEILSGTGALSPAYGLGRHRIVWSSVDNASGYELSYTEDGIWWTSTVVEETSQVISNIRNDTLIQYKVRALGDSEHYETSEWSTVKSFYVSPFDIDGDGMVGLGDYSAMADAWLAMGDSEHWDPRCDIDGDNIIGPGDFALLSANWLKDSDFIYPEA